MYSSGTPDFSGQYISNNVICNACRKSFSSQAALSYHTRTCRTTKKRTSRALEVIREAWEKQGKRRRIDHSSSSTVAMNTLTHGDAMVAELLSTALPVAVKYPNAPQLGDTDQSSPSRQNTPQELADDSSLSLAERRARRERAIPGRYEDFKPQLSLMPPSLMPVIREEPTSLPEEANEANEEGPNLPQTDDTRASLPPTIAFQSLVSLRNKFGLSRTYYAKEFPSHDPEEHDTLQALHGDPEEEKASIDPDDSAASPSLYHPYPNQTSFALGNWYWNQGTQKSQKNFKELIDIVGAIDFKAKDIRGTRWAAINRALGLNDFDDQDRRQEWEKEDAGWKRTPISLKVPFHRRMEHPGTQDRIVGDLYHRSIVSVIREKLANTTDDRNFHYEPYELSWCPSPGKAPVRVYGELFASPAFFAAHRELQDSDPEPGCNLPRCVVALMLWSDATHLTAFGNSKLWPSYLFFGNESKYNRCRPSMNLANHIAYFQTLPDSFKDFASEYAGGKGPNKTFLAHCNREMFHAQWSIVLDDEFIDAYRHGIVITCLDGRRRRFYPRILTYSADYPEKVLLASIRNRGSRPCPRCKIPKGSLGNMGMKSDMKRRARLVRVDDNKRKAKVSCARSIIYDQNYAVNGKGVEYFLKEDSLVPAANAFSDKLSAFKSFNLFQMLVSDILHDWEVGAWKAIFIHLIRILFAHDPAQVNTLDARFRKTPTFGRDTIRKFSANSSEMKKLAARDYEDLLQCAIPAFEELLPEPHNSTITDLLFICATWHGLAKLRLHTEDTLKIFENVTTSLGEAVRQLANDTSKSFQTRELPREAAARARRTTKGRTGKQKPHTDGPASGAPASDSAAPPIIPAPDILSGLRQATSSGPALGTTGSTAPALSTRRLKALNLETYKYHSLGDVAATIRQYGTTDSYSTEIGELEHRTVKARYTRTDRKEYRKQIARIERRQARIRRIQSRTGCTSRADDLSAKHAASSESHHVIGKTENLPMHIALFAQNNAGDPAVQDFIPKLKKHLRPRIKALLFGRAYLSTETLKQDDWLSVHLKHDRIYKHNIMRVNYTTYDVQRSEDVIHVNTTHRNIMVLNPAFQEDTSEHPFWYAQVLGIFHANVTYLGNGNTDYHPHRIEFLWVRWYALVNGAPSGWGSKRLDRVHFPPLRDSGSFGFLDPAHVLRACHVIPSFPKGKVYADGIRGASTLAGNLHDYQAYYINRFVDRDMLMRYYWGLAVGHIYTHGSGTHNYQAEVASRTKESSQVDVDIPESHPEYSSGESSDKYSSFEELLAVLDTLEDLDIEGDGGDGDEEDFDDDDMVYNDLDSGSDEDDDRNSDGADEIDALDL